MVDNDPDGYRVELAVYARGHYRYSLEVSGYPNGITATAADGGLHNLPEDTTITFEIWLYDGDTGRTAGFVTRSWYNDH